MSIKLYNGYIISKSSLTDLEAFSRKMARKLESCAYNHLCAFTAETVITLRDKSLIVSLLDSVPTTINKVLSNHYTAYKAARNEQETLPFELNVDASWVFIPHPFDSQKTLVLTYISHDKMQKIWDEFTTKAESPLKEFVYYNNQDKPDSISKKEWKEREKIWKLVLPAGRVPSNTGFTYKIFGAYDLPLDLKAKDVVARQPSLKKRVDSLAKELLLVTYTIERDITFSSSLVMRVLREFGEWYAKNPPEKLDLIARLTAALPEKYTEADLT